MASTVDNQIREVIPKGLNADTIDRCRNISCTNYLLKVLENFVLKRARTEVSAGGNQYSGEAMCGPAHLLIDAINYVTSSPEDNRAAVILTSLDNSKAFNPPLNMRPVSENF